MERWRVTYDFEPAVPMASSPPSIEALSLTVSRDDDGLMAVVHEFDSDESLSRDDAVDRSGAELALFLSLLEFLQRRPVMYQVAAVRLHPPKPSGLRLAGRATGTVGARPVEIPTVDWLALGRSNLRSWFSLAAQAQRSASPADALWQYGVILEDWEKRGVAVPERADVLRCLRHFVSHSLISAPSTMKVLQQQVPELNMSGSVYRFDPTDRRQRLILSAYREIAREFVEDTLSALLLDPERACR